MATIKKNIRASFMEQNNILMEQNFVNASENENEEDIQELKEKTLFIYALKASF